MSDGQGRYHNRIYPATGYRNRIVEPGHYRTSPKMACQDVKVVNYVTCM